MCSWMALPSRPPIGLRHLMTIGMEVIHERVRCLTSWLLDNLLSLYHSNGMPLVQVYGPHNDDRRGATIALNLLTPDGYIIDERVVDQRANEYKLSLRTGCFCNPGAAEAAFHVSEAVLLRLSKQIERMNWDQFLAAVGQCAFHLVWRQPLLMRIGACNLRRPLWIPSPWNTSGHRDWVVEEELYPVLAS
jgi:hypothetical protein